MTPMMNTVGWTLMHFVWQACVIAAPVAALLRLTARRSPNVRYVISCAGLAAMLVAPVATARLLWPAADEAVAGRLSLGADPNSIPTPADVHRAKPTIDNRRSSARAQSTEIQLPDLNRAAPAITIVWLAGVSLLLVRMAVGWWRVRRLHRRALMMDASRWQGACRRLAFRLGLAAAAHVVESAMVDVPTVVGWLRPAIVLPVAALATLTPSQVEAILAHELAHIRRHDYLVNVLQTFAETLLLSPGRLVDLVPHSRRTRALL